LKTKYNILLLLLISLFFACGNQQDLDKNPIVRVGKEMLYEEDLQGIIPVGVSKEDSLQIRKQYIENWIKKQLVIQEGLNSINIDEETIERKVQNYRYSLVMYELQKKYIEQTLPQKPSEKDIQNFYTKHPNNFKLAFPVVKGVYLKVPKNLKEIDSLENLIEKKENLRTLQKFCSKFAKEKRFFVQWTPLKELNNNTFFEEYKVDEILSQNFLKESDSTSMYYLKIYEIKKVNETAPLEFVKAEIIEILLVKQKVNLIKTMEENIYEKAKKENSIEFFNK